MEIEGCIASQHALVDHLTSIDDLDPSRASALPGWSVGHVLTHLARNADSHLEMLAGRKQYAEVGIRESEIEAGSGRSAMRLIEDLRESSAALEFAWLEALGRNDANEFWSGSAVAASGPKPVSLLPLLRWREVEIHWVDLGTGRGALDLDRHYLRSDLRVSEMLWRARKPIGLTPLPAAVLAAPPHDRLMWFLGRAEIEGIGPAA